MSGRLRDLSASGAFIETNHRPSIGSSVEIRHPTAGCMPATVARHAGEGIAVRFELGDASVRFALCVVAADLAHHDAPALALAGDA